MVMEVRDEMTFQEKIQKQGIKTNSDCSNCRYVAGAHGAISGLCPKDGKNDGTFFESNRQ